jgi:hypothetical protein
MFHERHACLYIWMDKDMAYVSVVDGGGPSVEDRCSGMSILGVVCVCIPILRRRPNRLETFKRR